MKTFLAGLTAATIALAGAATAQDTPFASQIKARQGIMEYRALQLGVLGGMAKGEVEYNAEAAQKAADNLMATVTLDASMLWPKGSDNSANPATAALPKIWEEGSDIGEKAKALGEAATAMKAAAGTGLDGLKSAMGPVGGACGGCHKAFRLSTN
ncbi:c-type cytochrome [Defluviimonas sp. SAOS-178_SWC]|uniref:c-type cytochrome n=1 Tax=Defluviimonas sp. SAOS-178_SWC TaxID=3121287 RepID=UPI003221A6F2